MFTRSNVMRDAGTTIFRRGEELYQGGAILDFRAEDKGFMDDVFARVKGSGRLSYKVRLRYNWDLDYMEDYSCECAAYLNYEGMCKHCVAVALKYIDEREDRPLISLLRERDGEGYSRQGLSRKKSADRGRRDSHKPPIPSAVFFRKGCCRGHFPSQKGHITAGSSWCRRLRLKKVPFS